MRTFCLLLFCSLLVSLPAAEITVTVFDKDLDLPLEGVKIIQPDGKTILTDADGQARATIPDDQARSRLSASLIGYEPIKFWATPKGGAIRLNMLIAGVVEGAELVVEQAKPQKTDEQVGVSQVATRDEIRSTAEMGMVEDVMSTIKALPGVGYNGGFGAALSIRGGKPGELQCVLDGSYVLYPYHWGGAYSILNPNMVDSAKLSNGLISAAYGQVLSGLLEINSRTPASADPQVDFSLSTTGFDLFGLVPFSDKAGLLIGGKVTWMSVAMGLANALNLIPADLSNITVPYIRDGYMRFYLKPDNTFEWDVNAFLGSDGTAVDSQAKDRFLTTAFDFNFENYFTLASTNIRAMVGNAGLFNFMVAWNREQMLLEGTITSNGTKSFDDAFIAKYHPPATSFTVKDLTSSLYNNQVINTGQGKLSFDLQVATGQILTAGAESILTTTAISQKQSFWQDTMQGGMPVYKKVDYKLDSPEQSGLNTGGYLTWNFDFGAGLLSGELGLRLDHSLLWNPTNWISVNPVVNPRLRLLFSPVKNHDWLDSLNFTIGSGVYSQVDDNSTALDKKYGLTADNFKPTRSWFNMVGIEAQMLDGWKASVEGYYKYYFDRMYIIYDTRTNPAKLDVKTDGTGYAYGLDVMIQKRLSRYWDGWLTYSYLDAKYLNPTKPAYDGQTTTAGELLDKEFFPNYHRFHTLNLISNWKPVDGFSIMAKLAVATGAPKAKVGEVTSYPAFLEDGTMIERFSRTSAYSDTDRNEISCPLDLKVTWSGFLGSGKVQWQVYIGVENVLANLYSPKGNTSFDPWYGNDVAGSSSADFNVGFPIPSIGFKLSY